ncbi:hypothetical protein GCM10011579_029110 [Streptomyces albiflavescens]|uniref:Uncharacterized protein n=1 Tax=Streptomyces albiflavescens TaxID=1623582 RepID=A0A918D3C0_9ACTN|nr:hypothetical protein [Streptomyces albiflavescens]GGN62200.1 hypothetical protein GCM10011579_029110 [Streptomyces albiflavescens]
MSSAAAGRVTQSTAKCATVGFAGFSAPWLDGPTRGTANNNDGQDETGAPSRDGIRAELVGRPTTLPLLRDQAARAKSGRVLPMEVVEALADAGVSPTRSTGSLRRPD